VERPGEAATLPAADPPGEEAALVKLMLTLGDKIASGDAVLLSVGVDGL
jgi:hypothetical protein